MSPWSAKNLLLSLTVGVGIGAAAAKLEDRPMGLFHAAYRLVTPPAAAKPCLYIGCGVKYVAPPKDDTDREKLLRSMRQAGASS
jgi:hypothetical protein